MTAWTPAELTDLAEVDELAVSSNRPDGSRRPEVTIWAVRVGDRAFIRSAYGPGNGWFRRALAAGTGHVRIGAVDRDVRFTVPEPEIAGQVDAAYHAKYDHYGPRIVNTVVGPQVVETTLELLPR
ncbi:DUF2255 family protein [Cellulomonas denverensis]|uniref:DUF2255 family protein n=1 Tax=Cellulomonas denverensis TaxID=264297 RepID=A0A7X6KTQ5_9CELL|nr:DUF2255 family protein [Cellulomonas denverensis]NKY22126.1 DUF2255 family protein [Cellulomonas denverensis]GIG26113.1 hypothetical protein Cde04nite_23570 [Cellulomonas denverensis]